MILEEVLKELRKAQTGLFLITAETAKDAADTIEMLVDKNRYLEEKLKEKAGR